MLHIIISENRDATVTLDSRGPLGTVYATIRTQHGAVMAARADHLTFAILGTIMDPGTAHTVLTFVGVAA